MSGATFSASCERGVPSALIRIAARWAPPGLGQRLEEEWLADLSAQPGTVQRWQLALGCCWAAVMIRHEHPVSESRGPSLGAGAGAMRGATMEARIMMAYTSRSASPRPASRALTGIGPVICDINTTPLIDVLLVLLVTLIVTLPMVTHAVKLDMPQGTPSGELPPEVLNLDVDFDGTVLWNGAAVPFEKLDGYFSVEAGKDPQPEIHLRADRRARYDGVARLLASAQRHGMRRIGFVDTGSFKDD